MKNSDPSGPVHADDNRLYRARLLLVLVVLAVPTAAVRGAVAAAKAALPDGRSALCDVAAAGRVLTAQRL